MVKVLRMRRIKCNVISDRVYEGEGRPKSSLSKITFNPPNTKYEVRSEEV